MKNTCYLVYTQIPDPTGGYYPEVLSSVAASEELARLICKDKENNGQKARWQTGIFWDDETIEFWVQKACDTQRL